MGGISVGIAGFAVLLILILARMPAGAAMALVGFVGFGWAVGFDSALDMLKTVPFPTFANSGISYWVLWFMLLGLCLAGGMVYSLFAALSKWFGNNSTGRLLAALFCCCLFSPVTAFSRVGLKPITKLLWPELRKCGCKPEMAVGVLAGGFSLGILFPLPTTFLIFYGVITEQSISKVILCSVPPTIISIILYVVAVIVKNWLTSSDNAVPKTSAPVKSVSRISVREKAVPVPLKSVPPQEFSAFKASWDIILIFIVIIFGPLSGALTSFESAALSVLLAVIFMALRRRLNKKNLYSGLPNGSDKYRLASYAIAGCNDLRLFYDNCTPAIRIIGIDPWLEPLCGFSADFAGNCAAGLLPGGAAANIYNAAGLISPGVPI